MRFAAIRVIFTTQGFRYFTTGFLWMGFSIVRVIFAFFGFRHFLEGFFRRRFANLPTGCEIVAKWCDSLKFSNVSDFEIRQEFRRDILFENLISKSVSSILFDGICQNPITASSEMFSNPSFFWVVNRDTDISFTVHCIGDFVDRSHNVSSSGMLGNPLDISRGSVLK